MRLFNKYRVGWVEVRKSGAQSVFEWPFVGGGSFNFSGTIGDLIILFYNRDLKVFVVKYYEGYCQDLSYLFSFRFVSLSGSRQVWILSTPVFYSSDMAQTSVIGVNVFLRTFYNEIRPKTSLLYYYTCHNQSYLLGESNYAFSFLYSHYECYQKGFLFRILF